MVSYLRNTHGVLMCYDVTNRTSFLSVRSWLEALISQEPLASVVLCACKCDTDISERQVATAEGETLSRILGVPYYETSAKTGLHVKDAIRAVAEQIAKRQNEGGVGAAVLQDGLEKIDTTGITERPIAIDNPASRAPWWKCW